MADNEVPLGDVVIDDDDELDIFLAGMTADEIELMRATWSRYASKWGQGLIDTALQEEGFISGESTEG